MTKQELEKLPALYMERNQLDLEIEAMEKSDNDETDVVRGGMAVGGKGRVIIIKGKGHASLPKKLFSRAVCRIHINKLESWIGNLPRNTSKEIEMRTILTYKYIYCWTNQEIGDEIGYSESAIRDKEDKFWEVQKSAKTAIPDVI